MSQVEHVIYSKVDMYLRHFIFSTFAPNSVKWWISASGGKDSFALTHALKLWYGKTGFDFDCTVFHVDQWNGESVPAVREAFRDFDLKIINAHELTADFTNYTHGQQAPCRKCANARRHVTDVLLSNHCESSLVRTNIVARGLHLSDTSISLLWRHLVGKDAAYALLAEGKSKPLSCTSNGMLIARPLFFVREFESELFARDLAFRPACCGCPACEFPSRRDIIEETAAKCFVGGVWEFDVPGVRRFLESWSDSATVEKIRCISLPGNAFKKPHLPRHFPDFAVDHFRSTLSKAVDHPAALGIDRSISLDDLGFDFIRNGRKHVRSGALPAPGIMMDEPLAPLQKKMIACLGPFWGAIALEESAQAYYFQLQEEICGIRTDCDWAHAHKLLTSYYNNASTNTHTALDSFCTARDRNHCQCGITAHSGDLVH